jgi:hypothetical protein
MELPFGVFRGVIQVVEYGRAYHDNVDIGRYCTWFAVIPSRPGAIDVRRIDPCDTGEERVARAVAEGQFRL